MTHVLLSERMGWHRHDDPLAPEWGSRHARARADGNAHPLSWCACPALRRDATPCAEKMTQEDSLCDQCREWCIGVDRHGVHHRAIDVRPAAATARRVLP